MKLPNDIFIAEIRRKEIVEMAYRLISPQMLSFENDLLHIIDAENSFVCRYELRDTEVRPDG
ncbi:MAG: hypothetical protein IJJ31_00690 [Mogibacterium sp.]|nr:hypothetical protein [Mogibacterium sp.]